MERLQKVMAHAGIASRRKCEEIILAGRVRVNGKTVKDLGAKVDKDDLIEVDGKPIIMERMVYVLLYKPAGYLSTVVDPRRRKTVQDLVGDIKERIYPVGRLDYDTSGLLLLTNDGELTYSLTHPSFQVEKTYLVEVKGKAGEALKRLEKGVELEDGKTAPARVRGVQEKGGNTVFQLTIHEGRNRQVRRMCEHIGYPVINLKRIAFAFLDLKGLRPGEYRFLSDEEVEKLKKLQGNYAGFLSKTKNI